MKQIDKSNRIWFETEGAVTKVGFTPQFLEKLQECFHIVPGKTKSFVRENGPLMALETNEGLFSITSPVRGVITFFEDKAMNFPEKLTTDDVVVMMQDKEQPKKEKKVEAIPSGVWTMPSPFSTDWADENFPIGGTR